MALRVNGSAVGLLLPKPAVDCVHNTGLLKLLSHLGLRLRVQKHETARLEVVLIEIPLLVQQSLQTIKCPIMRIAQDLDQR